MKTRCPACGATTSLDALLGHGDAGQAFVASLNLTGELAKPLVKYLAMFRSESRDLTFERTAKLLNEIAPDIVARQIKRGHHTFPAPLEAVLDRLKQLGFEVEAKDKTGVKNLASDAQSKLIRHLWIQLYEAGQVKNGSEQALAKFIENRVKVSALQFLSSENADMVINHLRQWCKRCGIERVTLEA